MLVARKIFCLDFVSTLFIHSGKIFAALSAPRGVWSAALPATGVDKNKNVPRVAALEQNHPNPFWSAAASPAFGGGNPSTAISFTLPKAEFSRITHYVLRFIPLLDSPLKP